MGQIGGLGEKDVLHHQKVRVLQGPADVVDVGVAEHGVLSHNVQGPDFPLFSGIYHLCHRQTDLGKRRVPPGFLKFLTYSLAGHCLVARVDVGQAAQVTGSLHVVLTAQGIDPGAGLSHVAGQHGQVGAGEDVVGAGGVLGDAHGIHDGRPFCVPVHLGGSDEVSSRDAGDLFHPFRGIFGHGRFQLLDPLRPAPDELFVFQALAQDDVHHAVKPGHVSARPLVQVQVSELG